LAELTARDQAAHPGSDELELQLERHRTELTAYAYRMLGSGFEAEDAVQEAFLRAWKSFERFEGDRRCARGCTAS
jgi:RNA polymerase sigma-70 factor (ECF subfamily)